MDTAPWVRVDGGTPWAAVLLCPLQSHAVMCSPCIPSALRARERNAYDSHHNHSWSELSTGSQQTRMLVLGQGGWDGMSSPSWAAGRGLLYLPVGDRVGRALFLPMVCSRARRRFSPLQFCWKEYAEGEHLPTSCPRAGG